MAHIEGVVVRPLRKHTDARGWLMELLRQDELPAGYVPAMGYLSVTRPGVARGPHEHREQADGFCFLSGEFRLTLWENRAGKARTREELVVGDANPVFVVVPAGVVHAYANTGAEDAFVLNFPDRLYAGWGRLEPVDEIRHEEIDSEFRL
ncbi:MAG: cupin domain-containing protein [Chthonomonadales bacterium]|nr:cupin domain-containing protein [Chthonomonadales bacterium]